MNDTEKLWVYQKAVADLVESLYFSFGASWEYIEETLRAAGMNDEEIELYNLESEINPHD